MKIFIVRCANCSRPHLIESTLITLLLFCRLKASACRHLLKRCITELPSQTVPRSFVQKKQIMKNKLHARLILGMIFLSTIGFGQTKGDGSEKIKEDKVPETYLSLVLNAVTTNLNYGKSNGVLADNKKSVFGGQLGVSFQAGITPKFSLVSELYFLMKGGKLETNNSIGVNNSTLRLYTLEFPVLARFHFGKLYVNAGPSIAYNLFGTNKIEGTTTDLSFNNSTGEFKRWDAGVQMGAGYRFKIKKKLVALDVRYSYGLTNISNSQEIYNRYLNLSLTFSKPWKTNPLGRKRKT